MIGVGVRDRQTVRERQTETGRQTDRHREMIGLGVRDGH